MGDFKETGFMILSSPIKIPDHLFLNNVNVNGPKKRLKNNLDLSSSESTEYSNSNSTINICAVRFENSEFFSQNPAYHIGYRGIPSDDSSLRSVSQSNAFSSMSNVLRINNILFFYEKTKCWF